MSTRDGSDTMSPPNEATKRKSDDGAGQPRAKRNRYISIACNECKRRKIKCNGQTPCQRCGNLSLECLYAPNCCNNFKESDEFKQMTAHMARLQQQLDDMLQTVHSLCRQSDVHPDGTPLTAQLPPPPPKHPRSTSFSKHPRFHGPTANAFNLGVARSSLQTMGITAADDGDGDGDGEEVATHDATPRASPSAPAAPLHADKDAVWALSKAEALRLVHVWYEEQGIMYPILDLDKLLRHADMLFSFVEAAARSGLMQRAMPGADAIMDDQTSVLKLVLAITLVMEGGGTDPLGERLFSNVQGVVERILSEPVSLQSVGLLTLTGMYHFTRDDEALAWRMIGLAARHCLELGLHRRETYAALFPDPDEQAAAVRIFWSVYVLDRRWSLGTGMPFALQDADMDHNLPKPDVSTHTSTPYLNAMISYSAIGSKVWKSVAASSSDTSPGSDLQMSKEDISFLDFQVLNWHRSIPELLRFKHPDAGQSHSSPPARVLHRLQILLYLRANQMRILIYRPVLHTATTILSHLDFAHTVVKVAKDTIRILTFINGSTDIYRCQQTMFNYFLISALAVLFLAVAHAPAEFSADCREEWYMALHLVRGLSSESRVSKRLWRTIRTLNEVGPRLGLVSEYQQQQQQQQHEQQQHEQSDAAVAMAGLAGHEMPHFLRRHGALDPALDPALGDTPHGIALHLTSLFEAAGSAYGINNPFDGMSGLSSAGGYEGMPAYGTENDELARIMRDLF
ncbi:uncharacterized protein M421DRAFT_57227 [Didymella exigua CBS 183.55]|uniref:Zn(2)-C6 fungal-type domain-containing protein n=1 Tax=Didymella exigua CBS 183.55 TaxID=1150837 RepID=A0A6A5RUI7_9PLEO|nr:uncharacterized protein M421DRAFT_57227 [Didymella exigua CBS 183.55]KAF1930824.1 hypothetical protein M421DRAFT_57227 [Didymella exigua CBS 183.55]